MSARDEITDLIYTYADRIDAGDFEGVGAILGTGSLTFDAALDPISGPDAITKTYEATTRRFANGTPNTKHVMTNVMVSIDPDEIHASSKSYYTVLHALPGEFALQPIIAGRYHDTFQKVNGKWQFLTMHIFVDLVGDLSTHLSPGTL